MALILRWGGGPCGYEWLIVHPAQALCNGAPQPSRHGVPRPAPFCPACALAPQVTTIAGNGLVGLMDGPVGTSRLNVPIDAALDSLR